MTVLKAWHTWCHEGKEPEVDDGATYRAVLDGCAITVRALCYLVGVECQFRHFEQQLFRTTERFDALLVCCNTGKELVTELRSREEQRCLLEVLFLGNRAVAHPGDELLDHKVGHPEMTSAINTVLQWLTAKKGAWSELAAVSDLLFQPIPVP